MLQEVREIQTNAVDALVATTYKQETIVFKSPTGTGKTYMMADYMNRVLVGEPDVVFLVSSLSKGELAEQNYLAFQEYQSTGKFSQLNPYLISSATATEESLFIPVDYNVYVLPRDLYKQKGKLMRGPMAVFMHQLTGGPLTGGLGKRIFLIKDECHVATTNLDELSSRYCQKTINFSATPALKRGQIPDVQVREEDAVNAHLIKRVEWQKETETVEDALKLYTSLKGEYIEKLQVNPCLIIQISNKDKADEEWAALEPLLNRYNMQWMYIVNEDKKCKTNNASLRNKTVSTWRKYAKANLSEIEVIVFKLTITEGWDIRRACMLYQIRDTQSKQLDEQVIGRVRRNPRLLDYERLAPDAQSLADVAYVWGVREKEVAVTRRVRIQEHSNIQTETRIKTTRLKDLTDSISFSVDDIIAQKRLVTGNDIFRLYAAYDRTPEPIKQLGRSYAKSYRDWMLFMEALPEITVAYNRVVCDYDKSMELATDIDGSPLLVTFQNESHFTETHEYINIFQHVWYRTDGSVRFYFDSRAEKDWADILREMAHSFIKKDSAIDKDFYLWGKNYLPGSSIKYEYYLDGIHVSYPDFIMKDTFDRIHLFEVKSVNGQTGKLDTDAYLTKTEELKRCYKQASKLTGHIFYLPIQKDESWQIYQYNQGTEAMLSLDQLYAFLRTP